MLKLYHCDISKMSDDEFIKFCYGEKGTTKEKMQKLNKKRAKKLSVAAGALVRRAIAEEFNIDKDSIRFRRDKKGKPYTESAKVEFSISHSKSIAVCAISDRPVGIDIEKMRDVNFNVAKRLFTPDEQKYVFQIKKLQKQRFFEVWTRKEAYVKLLGYGIPYFPKFSVMKNENIETIVKKHYVLSVARKVK